MRVLGCVFLLTFISVVQGQSLTSSESVVKRPGEPVTLSCTVSGFSMSSHYIHWIRQKPGKGLEWIGWIDTGTGTKFAQSLQGQFSITKENSKNQLDLEVKNLKAEDSAVYYCAKETGWSNYAFDYWGKGTMVTVSSATATAPTLFPLAQCGSGTRDMMTLGCMATGFTPASITFKWKDSAMTALTDFIQYPSVQSNGHYRGVSQISVNKADWEKKDFICAVEHSTGEKTVTIKKPVPAPPVSPSLYLMTPSKDEINDNQTASFACLATGFSPKEYTITWLKDKNPINEEVTNFYQEEKKGQGHHMYSATSFLKVNHTDWTDSGSEFTCKFVHTTGTQTKTVKYATGDCDGVDEHVDFKFTEPTPENLFLEDLVPIRCEATATKKIGFTLIKWSKADGTVIMQNEDKQLSKTKTVSATIKITKEEWNEGKPFTCTVEHKDILGSEEKTYKRENGNEKMRPSVFLLAPSEDTSNNMVTLTCYVKDFYPKEVLVAWLVNDELVQMDSNEYEYNTTSPIETGTTYYSVYGHLRMSMDDWKVDGVVYSCAVYHETLPKSTKMLVRTVDKTSNKPNLVNLSLNVPGCKA